ncbi:MAG: hypothetical protein V4617_02115 [Gemmatimonadota bacterium]
MVLDRLLDHANGKNAKRGCTRELVHLHAKDLSVLGQMVDVVGYARMTFARTGISLKPDVE